MNLTVEIIATAWFFLRPVFYLYSAWLVMKICGWRDLKTMEFYIRVAGVEEKGATDCLKILPSEAEVMGNVVELFQH